tara:strand:- start:131 stop:355 length:225 start_codon:yes stop_codon:yes gene_type:complete
VWFSIVCAVLHRFNYELQRLLAGGVLMLEQLIAMFIMLFTGYMLGHLVAYKLKKTKQWHKERKRKKQLDEWSNT